MEMQANGTKTSSILPKRECSKRNHFGLFITIVSVGILGRLLYAWSCQGRVWIDEMWVSLNPAFRLLTGFGPLHPEEWGRPIHSWLPPSWVALLLAPLHLFGLSSPTVAPPLLRILLSLAQSSGLVAGLLWARRTWGLTTWPWMTALVVFFVPEWIRFSSSADLSVLALPFLLWGLWWSTLAPFSAPSVPRADEPDTRSPLSGIFGGFFLGLAILMRIQFAPALAMVVGRELALTLQKRNSLLLPLVAGAMGSLALCLFVDRVGHGYWVFPQWHYFLINTVEGRASGFGTSPFYAAFEIGWRQMTEPVFFGSLIGCLVGLKRKPRWESAAALLLFLAHALIPHKEFRFFYGPGILLALVGIPAWETWWTNTTEKVGRPRWRVFATVTIASLSFCSVAAWRGLHKVSWMEFEVPSRLESWVGEQKDVKGLLSFGWGGIRSGGAFTFHRTLPYRFAERREELWEWDGQTFQRHQFNYVICPTKEPPPCKEALKEYMGATVYRCSAEEMDLLTRHPSRSQGE